MKGWNCQWRQGHETRLRPRTTKVTGGEMKTKGKRKPPEVVYREGKPRAVILDIEEYQEMLERLEDVEDLQMLE